MKPLDVYSVFDIEIDRALGSTLWDVNGQTYLDLYGGHAVISIGHSHPHYVKSITEQVKKIGFYSNSIKLSQQEELASKLGQLSGYDDYKLFLCNSGAEANENAFKIASFHNGRKKIIAFEGAFHGRTSLAVAATDNKGIRAAVNQNDDIVFLPLNDLQALHDAMDDNVCAVIIEGIQGVAGVIEPSTEFLVAIEALCQKFGAKLILDEVQSGYGRSGKFFAHQWAGVRPDIITVAKGMGNGFPIAAVLVHPDIELKKEQLGTTFGGSYLACAAGIAVLDIIKNEDLIAKAHLAGEYLKQALSTHSTIKEIRGRGLMLGLVIETPCAALRKELLFNKHIFTGSASDKNTIRILPALNVEHQQLEIFANALQALITPHQHEILQHG